MKLLQDDQYCLQEVRVELRANALAFVLGAQHPEVRPERFGVLAVLYRFPENAIYPCGLGGKRRWCRGWQCESSRWRFEVEVRPRHRRLFPRRLLAIGLFSHGVAHQLEHLLGGQTGRLHHL